MIVLTSTVYNLLLEHVATEQDLSTSIDKKDGQPDSDVVELWQTLLKLRYKKIRESAPDISQEISLLQAINMTMCIR